MVLGIGCWVLALFRPGETPPAPNT